MGSEPRSVLSGRRIIVTRSEADNRSLTATLSDLGATVLAVPLVEVIPPGDDGRALAAATDRLADYRWVVLTSVNGVDALGRALEPRPWPSGTTVVPVGPATAEAARAAGMTTAPPPPEATAAALVDLFGAADGRVVGGRVLAPLAELAASTVTDGLVARGYRVDRVTAYRTRAPAARDLSPPPAGGKGRSCPEADAVAFFSPSAVDRFVDRFGSGRSVPPVVVCIGPSTTTRAAERGLVEPVTADAHTESGVVAALIAVLGR